MTALTQDRLNSIWEPAFTRMPAGILRRMCACGQHTVAGGECEACRKKREASVQRAAVSASPVGNVPPIVHDVLRSPGQPLDMNTRAFMEPRFGHDFSGVRVHTDAQAADSARAIHALAYTVGRDVVFGAGQYTPGTTTIKKLLAHELTHVAQQYRGSGEHEAESRAEAAAEQIKHGGSVTSSMIGSAAPGLYRQNDNEPEHRRTLITEPAFNLNWETLAQFGLTPSMPPLTQPGAFQLTPPSLRVPALAPPSLGIPSLRPPLIGSPTLRPPWLTPPPTPAPATTPEPPSRLPVLTRGQFSLGLRLDFPEVEAKTIPGAPASALGESLRRAQILDQILTGTVPTGWDAIDKADLAKAIWGIFSTNIAPSLAQRISSGLSAPTQPGQTSYELDLLILGDFSGGGISFTVRH